MFKSVEYLGFPVTKDSNWYIGVEDVPKNKPIFNELKYMDLRQQNCQNSENMLALFAN